MCTKPAWLLSFFLMTGAACTAVTTIVHQPDRQITRRDGTSVSKTELGAAIRRALARRNWSVKESGDGNVLADVSAGGHTATVRITYGAGTYKIAHVESSEGLRYDGKEIHHRYNHWIRRLESTLRKELDNRVRVTRPGSLPSSRPNAADDLK